MKIIKITIFLIISGLFFLSLPAQTPTAYDLGVQGTNYDIARDNNGDVHLVWVNSDNYKKLYYAKIVNNALSGIESVTLTYKVHVRFTRPRMAVRPDGSEIHVTYISPGPGSYVLDLWRNSSGVWHEDVVWSKGTSKYYMAFPAIGVDASGNVHVIAQRWVGETQNYVAYWRKPAGGSWPGYVGLEPDTNVSWRDLSMFTDSSGGVHATWKTGGRNYGRYKYAANGASLADGSIINIPKPSDVGNMVSFGDTFATDNGDVHHVYFLYPETVQSLWHTVKRNGSSTFGELTEVSAVNNCEHCGSYYYENPWPSIIVGPDGTPVIAWAQNENQGVVNSVNVAYKDLSTGLWVPSEMDNDAYIHMESRPVMTVVDSTGYMVWRGGNGNLKLMVYTLTAATGVLSPNGGEEWKLGETYDIVWNLENATGNVDINLYKGGTNLGPIVSDIDDSGSYSWTIGTLEDLTPIAVGSDYKIEVKARDGSDSDQSNADFTINPSIVITSPDSGSNWVKGTQHAITWEKLGTQHSDVKIRLFRDGVKILNITDLASNSGSFLWTVPETVLAAGNYVVRVKTIDNIAFGDSELFSISDAPATITITSPSSGDRWQQGSVYNITWDQTGTQDPNVKIRLLRNGVKVLNITDLTANDGSFSWTVPMDLALGTDYVVRVKTVDNLVYDDSDNFEVTEWGGNPVITITSPASGDGWENDKQYNITWNKNGTQDSNVKIRLFRNGLKVLDITDSTSNDGSFSWTVPSSLEAAANYIIRVKTTDNLVSDNSDEFSISRGIAVKYPGLNSVLTRGNSYTVTWTKTGTQNEFVKIRLFRNGVKVLNITDSTNNDGSYNWTVPSGLAAGENYRIRVKTVDNLKYDDSDPFEIE